MGASAGCSGFHRRAQCPRSLNTASDRPPPDQRLLSSAGPSRINSNALLVKDGTKSVGENRVYHLFEICTAPVQMAIHPDQKSPHGKAAANLRGFCYRLRVVSRKFIQKLSSVIRAERGIYALKKIKYIDSSLPSAAQNDTSNFCCAKFRDITLVG